MVDPNLQIRGSPVIHTLSKKVGGGGGEVGGLAGSQSKNFSASVWFQNKDGAQVPRPFPWIRH